MSKRDIGLDLFRVGWDKNGEMDFGVNGTFTELSHEEMEEWRSMVVVAIGTAEDMWRRSREDLAGKADAQPGELSK